MDLIGFNKIANSGYPDAIFDAVSVVALMRVHCLTLWLCSPDPNLMFATPHNSTVIQLMMHLNRQRRRRS